MGTRTLGLSNGNPDIMRRWPDFVDSPKFLPETLLVCGSQSWRILHGYAALHHTDSLRWLEFHITFCSHPVGLRAMIIFCAKDKEVWRADTTSWQEHLNRHLMHVRETNTWPFSTEGLPGKIYFHRIDKCPGRMPAEGRLNGAPITHSTARWKFHGEMNIHDLSYGSTYSSPRRRKIAKVKKSREHHVSSLSSM